MNKYILFGIFVYLLVASGCCMNDYELVEYKSGGEARRDMLERKYSTGVPTEAQAWHMLYFGHITKQQYYEYREIRRQQLYSMSDGSYGLPLPPKVHHETFSSFLLHSLVGAADGKVK